MESIRRYSELIRLPSFRERFQYLRLDGNVGVTTFGFDRYMNQSFYRSADWKRVRNEVIIRDLGCDLGIEGRETFGPVLIHHMNPIRPEDIRSRSDILLNPEYLITTIHETHQAIHYGDESLLIQEFAPRQKNDTCPWKHEAGGSMRMKHNQNDCDQALAPEPEAFGRKRCIPLSGVVTDCMRLNVREEPRDGADVVTRISALTEVIIDEEASTSEYYKICTPAGIEGFCMKRYIALRR